MESLVEKRKKGKQLKFKKGIIIFSITSSILLSGTMSAMAEEVTFDSKVKEFSTAVLNALIPKLDQQMEVISTFYSNSISEHVTNRFTGMQILLNQHAEQEKMRAEEEISAYYNERIAEIDKKTESEINRKKKQITQETNNYIKDKKAEIDQNIKNEEKSNKDEIEQMQSDNHEETDPTADKKSVTDVDPSNDSSAAQEQVENNEEKTHETEKPNEESKKDN